jgi:hypothetical protein
MQVMGICCETRLPRLFYSYMSLANVPSLGFQVSSRPFPSPRSNETATASEG